jgi:hypothetical protein
MAHSPILKIYDNNKNYIGCVKAFEDANTLVCGAAGWTIRFDGHARKNIIWTEPELNDSGGRDDDFHEMTTTAR